MTIVAGLGETALDSLRLIVEPNEATTAGITTEVLDHLRQLVPADQALSFELDVAERRLISIKGSPDVEIRCEPMFERAFWSAFGTCAPCTYYELTGDFERICFLSDFYTAEELRQTTMYRLFENLPIHRAALDHAMTAVLPSPTGIEARIMLVRGDRDFDESDRTMLALLRPHLAAVHRRGTERREGLTALTPRQQTILHLVARGFSNDEIAQRLVVSPGTVRKHLDNAFRQLGVSSRAAAVARAFPDGVPAYPNFKSSPASVHQLPRARDGRSS